MLVSVMIATLIELDLIFTAYFLKHREISEDIFKFNFNSRTIHPDLPEVSFF